MLPSSNVDHVNSSNPPVVVTQVELDEAQMELGRDYLNYPESQFKNNPKYPTFRGLKFYL